jgi:hypothetical protein
MLSLSLIPIKQLEADAIRAASDAFERATQTTLSTGNLFEKVPLGKTMGFTGDLVPLSKVTQGPSHLVGNVQYTPFFHTSPDGRLKKELSPQAYQTLATKLQDAYLSLPNADSYLIKVDTVTT